MPNPYIIDVPQIQNQDPQGLSPIFQNANAQQQFMNSQLGQGGQLGQYQNYGTSQGGSGALALAQALRKPTDPNTSQGASMGDKMANYFGTQQTPEMQAQINQLGSNTWNPMSDYNTGANGWGSFGE
jgi:hypothetical protein